MTGELLSEKIGKYSIVGELGKGGFGRVLLGRHPELQTSVAIKFVHPNLHDDPEAQARFEREARVLAGLRHPAIVRVHDYFVWEDRPVLVMERVEGRTLADRLEEGALEPEKALPLLRQVAEGLAAAHEAGIVHRDLKAENVMLSPDEKSVVLLDFGLAKPVGELDTSAGDRDRNRDFITGPNQWIGTPHAMSPEQIRGRNLDARSDLFSFGALAYHVVTGRRPFLVPQDPDATRVNVKTNRQVSATNVAPSVPLELSALLDRLLAKDREARPARASEVVAELQHMEYATAKLSYDSPSDAALLATRLGEQPRRRRALLGVLGLLAIVVSLLGLGFRMGFFVSDPPPDLAVLGIAPADPDAEGSGWVERAATEILEEGLRIALPHAVEYRTAMDAIQQDLDFHPTEPPSTEGLRDLAQQSTAGLWLGGTAGLAADGTIGLELWLQRAPDGEVLHRWTSNASEDRWLDALVAIVDQISEDLGENALSAEESDRLRRLFPQDAESARLYFGARAASARFDTQRARELLEEGISTEDHPSYLLALADAYWQADQKSTAADLAKRTLAKTEGVDEIDRLRMEARACELRAEGADREDWLLEASRAYGRLFELTENPEFGIRQLEIDAEMDVPEKGCPPTRSFPETALSLREQARISLARGRACIKLRRYDESEEPLYRAASNARTLGLDFLEGSAWLSLGRAQDHLKSPTALESLGNARAAFERARSLEGVEASIKRMALLYSRNGDPERARQTMESYLQYLEKDEQSFSTAVLFANNSIALGELAFARGLMDEILKDQHDLTDREQAEARTALGLAHHEDGDSREAERLYRLALATFEALELPIQGATILYNLGEIAWQQGDLLGAESLFRRAMEMEDLDETDPYYAWALGRLAAGKGDTEAALHYFVTTDTAFDANNADAERAKAMIDRASLELDRRNLATAPEIAAQARDILEQGGYALYATRARLALAEAHRRQGDFRALAAELLAIRSKLDEMPLLAIRDLRTRAEILEVWNDASAGGEPVEAATERLGALAQQATAAGFAWVAYEARLIAIALAKDAGDRERASSLARSVRADAEARGHGRITKRLDVLLPRS